MIVCAVCLALTFIGSGVGEAVPLWGIFFLKISLYFFN